MLRTKQVLWILLIITLVFSMSGVAMRMANEAQNKSVVTTLDYREFVMVAAKANVNLDELLTKLKANGASRLSVKETSIRDLEFAGKVQIKTFSEVQADIMYQSMRDWKVVLNEIAHIPISPVNLTVITSEPEVVEFLTDKLAQRYVGDEIVHFNLSDKHFFIINTQIAPPVKTDKEVYPTDVLVGFDTNLMDKLAAQGFEIVLSPGNSTGTNLAYIDDYEKIIKDYHIKYVVINAEVSGAPDNLAKMEQLITDNKLIVGLIEMPIQLGFLQQLGLTELIEKTDYPVNRVYSSRNDEYLKQVDERYYRWVRSVVDRGIRIVHVVPFQNDKVSYSQNLEDTTEVIGRFHETITEKGYSINEPIPLLSAEQPGKIPRLMVGLSLLLATMLYLTYLFRMKPIWVMGLLGIGGAGLLGINLALDMDLSKIYALGAAILYPTLSSLLLLLYLRDNNDHSFIRQIITSLTIILGINAIGMFTIVTSLADIRYIMNIEYFRGVKLAFLLPLLLFFLNYLSVFSGEAGIVNYLTKYLKLKPNFFILMLLGLGVIALYYYLGRSGHTAGVSVSSLELRMREILESIFLARPRFKEILIGYPALFVMVYLYKKYKEELLTLVLGLGVMMGSISMVNSFSHVFTAVNISIQRTIAGLITGVLIAIFVMVGIVVLEKLYELIRE